MSQPPRVLYLPPGVVPPNAQAPVPVTMPTGLPFDRAFFEQVLPQSIAAFCNQMKCTSPVVELLTMDGTTHFVKGISGVADAWVALHTTIPDHDHAVQVFIPYATIFRVAVHPCDDDKRPLGFILDKDENRQT